MSKKKTWQELKAEHLTPEQQAEAKDRAFAELIELRLSEFRQALEMTQDQVAGELGRQQSAVAALEKRGDMLVSTLRKYVAAMGGHLEIVAHAPKLSSPIRISLA